MTLELDAADQAADLLVVLMRNQAEGQIARRRV